MRKIIGAKIFFFGSQEPSSLPALNVELPFQSSGLTSTPAPPPTFLEYEGRLESSVMISIRLTLPHLSRWKCEKILKPEHLKASGLQLLTAIDGL